MIWWLLALSALVVPIVGAEAVVPAEWKKELFSYSLWGASFFTLIISFLLGWLWNHLQQLVDAGAVRGWREYDRRLAVVNAVRRRLAAIVVVMVVLGVCLFFLPLLGQKLPEPSQGYAMGVPFGTAGFVLFVVVSALRWLARTVEIQRTLQRERAQRAQRDALLERLRGGPGPSGGEGDPPAVLTGRIVDRHS